MKKMSVLMVLAAFLATGLVSPAVAAKKFKSNVELTYQPGTYNDSFFGEVNSKRAACEKQRIVSVRRQQQGPDVLVGQDTTDNNGDYSVTLGGYAQSGTYYARAKKKVLFSGKVCRAAKSNTVTVF